MFFNSDDKDIDDFFEPETSYDPSINSYQKLPKPSPREAGEIEKGKKKLRFKTKKDTSVSAKKFLLIRKLIPVVGMLVVLGIMFLLMKWGVGVAFA